MADKKVTIVKEEDLAEDNPIKAFILSELREGLLNIREIGEQIKKLIQLIRGEIPLVKDLKQLGIDLMSNTLPNSWFKMWEGPSTPSEWLKQFFKKVISLDSWLKKIGEGKDNSRFFNEELSLSDLFNPEVFLNAHRLIVSKETKVSMESLKLVLSFSKNSKSNSSQLKLGGLLIQGCKFSDGKVVNLSENDSEEFNVMPTCFVSYVEASGENGDLGDERNLSVPLYGDFTRENLICYFDMEIDGMKREKIISGVAMAIN